MVVRRLGGWAVWLLGLLAAQPPNRLTAQSDAAAPTIDSIIIENKNVFDRTGDAPDWVAHVANALHDSTGADINGILEHIRDVFNDELDEPAPPSSGGFVQIQ